MRRLGGRKIAVCVGGWSGGMGRGWEGGGGGEEEETHPRPAQASLTAASSAAASAATVGHFSTHLVTRAGGTLAFSA